MPIDDSLTFMIPIASLVNAGSRENREAIVKSLAPAWFDQSTHYYWLKTSFKYPGEYIAICRLKESKGKGKEGES